MYLVYSSIRYNNAISMASQGCDAYGTGQQMCHVGLCKPPISQCSFITAVPTNGPLMTGLVLSLLQVRRPGRYFGYPAGGAGADRVPSRPPGGLRTPGNRAGEDDAVLLCCDAMVGGWCVSRSTVLALIRHAYFCFTARRFFSFVCTQ